MVLKSLLIDLRGAPPKGAAALMSSSELDRPPDHAQPPELRRISGKGPRHVVEASWYTEGRR